MNFRNSLSILLVIFSLPLFSQVTAADSSHINESEPPSTDIDSILKAIVQPEIKLKDTLSFIGVGDIMYGTSFPSKKYLPPFPAYKLFAPVTDILLDADVTFGNLEGSFLNKGKVVKRCKDTTLCYAFRMPDSLAPVLQKNGFDLMSLANNHIADFGERGMQNTIRLTDSLGIKTAGLLIHPTSTIQVDSLTIGLAAFSPNNGTCSITDIETAVNIIKGLDKVSDIIIVSFHGGAEGKDHQNITRETEKFYGENRGNVYEFSHRLVDAGADIIFGHGPHVARAVEVYKNRIIAYSLGNFCTYARFNLSGANGLAPILKVFTTREGEFLVGEIISARQSGEGGPVPDPYHRAAQKIKALTETDFPENPVMISPEGKITYREKAKN